MLGSHTMDNAELEQVMNVSKTTVVRDAWMRGQELAVHGWVYDIHDGLLRDLGICISGESEIANGADAPRAALVRTT